MKTKTTFLFIFLISSTTIFAALEPKYEAVRRAKYEHSCFEELTTCAEVITGTVMFVDTNESNNASDRVTKSISATVKINKVLKSNSNLKPGKEIIIEYQIQRPARGWVGPVIYSLPVLKPRHIYRFYLKATERKQFSVVAGDMGIVSEGVDKTVPVNEMRLPLDEILIISDTVADDLDSVIIISEEQFTIIQSMARRSQSGQKKLNKKLELLSESFKKCKAEPDEQKKAEFELQLSSVLNSMLKGIDDIAFHKKRTELAYQGINNQIKQTIQSLDCKLKKTTDSELKLQKKETELIEIIKKMTLDIKNKGDEATKKEIHELKSLIRKFKFIKFEAKPLKLECSQYTKFLSFLGKVADQLEKDSKAINTAYQELKFLHIDLVEIITERRKKIEGEQCQPIYTKLKDTLYFIEKANREFEKFDTHAETALKNITFYTCLDTNNEKTFK